ALPACASSTSAVRATNTNAGAMDDATVTARVKAALLNDPQVDATKVDVTTNGGIVTLTGTVRSKAEEARAIELARKVTGVREFIRRSRAVEQSDVTMRDRQRVAQHRSQRRDTGTAGNEDESPLGRIGRERERTEGPFHVDPRSRFEQETLAAGSFRVRADEQ